jgi:hypothetical protein
MKILGDCQGKIQEPVDNRIFITYLFSAVFHGDDQLLKHDEKIKKAEKLAVFACLPPDFDRNHKNHHRYAENRDDRRGSCPRS